MKFVASSNELLAHMQILGRVINSKNNLPILDNFLLQLKGNELKIIASDLETTMISTILLGNTEQEGSIALPARILTESLKKLPEQPITFDINTETHAVIIRYENGRYTIAGQSGEDFPEIPELKEEKATSASLKASAILDGINNTLYATANDELRPIMNGILVEFGEADLTLVASDAHKLVRYKRSDVQPGQTASFILPKKPAGLIKSILSKNTETIEISFDDRNARFSTPQYTLICRLTEGNYPAYNSVIPKNNPNKLTIDRMDFCNALERVAIFANQASNLVKLEIKGNELVLSAQDIDFSTSSQERTQCHYEGDDIEIGFKASFLIEILSNLNSENILFEMSDPSRAGLILPLQTEPDEDILTLLMPMMVNA
jgi:DNA polymerase-3 subunit beta